MTKNYTIANINGIKTVIYPLKDISAIKVELLVKAGSRYETKDSWGAFHLLEHLSSQKTEKFTSKYELNLFQEKHGLTSNAYTGENRVGFWVKGPYYSLKQALELLNQEVFHPTFSQKFFTKEISIIGQEYRDKWDSPYTRFNYALNQQLYGKKHPYSRDGMGQPEYIKNLTQKDITKLHQNFFSGKNCYLAVAGKLNIKETKKLIKEILKPKTNHLVKLPLIPKTKPQKKLIHFEPVEQTQIVLTWPLPGFNQVPLLDRIKFSVAKYILGGGLNSLLKQELREKHGLAYRVSAHNGLKDNAGYFEIEVSTDPQNKQKALNLLRETTYNFINKPINPKRFNQAISFMNDRTVIHFDSVDNIAADLINDIFNFNRIYLPQDYIKISKKITPHSTSKLIQKYITPKNELMAFLEKKSS